jgi:hypothetical protein
MMKAHGTRNGRMNYGSKPPLTPSVHKKHGGIKMTKTLSDHEMLKEFDSAVRQGVFTATALKNQKPPADPIEVQIGQAYEMCTAHLFLCHALRKAQKSQLSTQNKDTIGKLIAILRSIYSLPNAPEIALNDLKTCVTNLVPPGKAFALPQLLWCVFPEALSWSKHLHDSVDVDHCLGKGETALVMSQLEAAARLLDSLDKLATTQIKKYKDAAAQNKFYRDHLIHPVRVAWLMETLIRNWGWIYEQSAREKLRQTYNNCPSGDQFPNGWPASVDSVGRDHTRLGSAGRAASLTAALFHDMHAGASGACSLSVDGVDSLSRPVDPFVEDKFARIDLESHLKSGFWSDRGSNFNAKDLVTAAVDRLRESNRARPPKAEWWAAFERSLNDHGVRAAAELANLPPEARQAIALHNLFETNVATIDPMEAPVAFFLVLCDEAQEWGRWVRKSALGEYSVLVEKGDLEIDNKCFRVSFDFSNAMNGTLAVPFEFDRLVNDKEKNLRRLTIPKDLDLSISYSLKDIKGDLETISWRRDTGWKRE